MQRDGEPAIDRAEAERLVAQHPWWYHQFEIYPGVVTPGVYDPSALLAALKLPANLNGKTILELGPADGYSLSSSTCVAPTSRPWTTARRTFMASP